MSDNTLLEGLKRIAKANPELRKQLVPVIREASVSKEARETWKPGNPMAPWTPWGPAITAYTIAGGVTFFEAVDFEGGLRVTSPAFRLLSPALRKLAGPPRNSDYWFEMDPLMDLVLYERPEWLARMEALGLVDTSGGTIDGELTPGRRVKLERMIQRTFPRYFFDGADEP
jgi:hypothetical protein